MYGYYGDPDKITDIGELLDNTKNAGRYQEDIFW